MNQKFICPLCGNTDQKYVGIKNGKFYCRKCISFRGEKAEEHKVKQGIVSINLKYPLSKEQKEISDKLIENYKKGINSLVDAVCGAGKTEIVYGIMAYALSHGQNVAFALPRRDVAQELYWRIKEVFNTNSVILVCGGHHQKLTADIVVLTTHQLFRYEKYFSLIIMDEIDAFPYSGNDVLSAFFLNACKGNFVQMSATPNNEVLQRFSQQNHDILNLNIRFHRQPLPVPKLVIKYSLLKYIFVIQKTKEFIKENKPVFIFTATIGDCEFLFRIMNSFIKKGSYVHSKCSDRAERIQKFRDGKTKFLVTTAVLERGVTVSNLQVIVFGADHRLYDSGTLIQISGRVGRKINATKGEVVFIASKETNSIKTAIETIRRKNCYL